MGGRSRGMAERRGSGWAELDRRRSYQERKKSLLLRTSRDSRKSLWDVVVATDVDHHRSNNSKHDAFRILLEDLEQRVGRNGAGVLWALLRTLKAATRLPMADEAHSPALHHFLRTLLPNLVGFVYMAQPLHHWYEPQHLRNADESVLQILIMAQDLLSAELKFLVQPQATNRFTNAIALLRIASMASDKTTYFHRTHKHRPIPSKFVPYGAHHFVRCLAGADGTDKCIGCGASGARTKYRWIGLLVESFGQVNWTNFEFLARVLENPRHLRVLPLDATEAILGFVAKVIEFLDVDLARSFLPGALAVMELLVRRDGPVDPERGVRPSDRFISAAFMLDRHLDAIFGHVLNSEAKDWLMGYARGCKYRALLGYKPLKLW